MSFPKEEDMNHLNLAEIPSDLLRVTSGDLRLRCFDFIQKPKIAEGIALARIVLVNDSEIISCP
jgi:hypothetical protein